MNYQRIHDQIIERAKSENRKKNDFVYYELHHIVPRCLGGTGAKINLILLTAREHFLIHWLLVQIFPSETKLWYALNCMIRGSSSGKRYYPSSRIIAFAKEKFIEIHKEYRHPEALVKRIADQLRGKKLSAETVQKMSIAFKGRFYSEETKANMSAAAVKVKGVKVDKFDLQNNYIQTYDSVAQAYRENVGINNILATCMGEQRRSGQFIWKYTNKPELYDNKYRNRQVVPAA